MTEADRLQDFASEKSAALMTWLQASEENLKTFLMPVGKFAKADRTDGLRLTLEDGSIIHFRPSGNAPEMRCYVEAADANLAMGLLENGLNLLKTWETT